MSRVPTDLLARLDYFYREVERLFQRQLVSALQPFLDEIAEQSAGPTP